MDEIVNRSAVIVRPKTPYLEWCKQDDAEGLAGGVFEQMCEEPHIYLLPAYEDSESQRDVLKDYWPALFEAMLEGWVTEESLWPQERSLKMFREWFEITMTSMVLDLDLDEPLEYYE